VAAVVAAAACGGNADERVRVPSNATGSLGNAVDRLLAAGLRISIPSFPPQPCGAGLGDYFVAVQEPRAPALVKRGTIVTVKVHSSLIPSPAFPSQHPPFVTVPRLVGLRYGDAMRRIPEGLWICLERVPPLTPEKSTRGFDAFVVASQRPRSGTRLAYGCARTREPGCRVTVVQLSLAVP
jgi:hypothetical protein